MSKPNPVRRVAGRIVGIFVLYQIAIRVARKLFHFPVPAFVGPFLGSPIRRALQPPSLILERSGIRKGTQVLEVGCGSGGFTVDAARAVGDRGGVCALDIQPAMLRQLEDKLRRPEHRDVRNVALLERNAYELPFEDETFDLVYMVTVLPEIPDQGRALAEVRRVLKPGGTLAVTEWLPDPDYPLWSTTARRGGEAGFEVDAVLGNLWTYTVRLKRKGTCRIER